MGVGRIPEYLSIEGSLVWAVAGTVGDPSPCILRLPVRCVAAVTMNPPRLSMLALSQALTISLAKRTSTDPSKPRPYRGHSAASRPAILHAGITESANDVTHPATTAGKDECATAHHLRVHRQHTRRVVSRTL